MLWIVARNLQIQPRLACEGRVSTPEEFSLRALLQELLFDAVQNFSGWRRRPVRRWRNFEADAHVPFADCHFAALLVFLSMPTGRNVYGEVPSGIPVHRLRRSAHGKQQEAGNRHASRPNSPELA